MIIFILIILLLILLLEMIMMMMRMVMKFFLINMIKNLFLLQKLHLSCFRSELRVHFDLFWRLLNSFKGNALTIFHRKVFRRIRLNPLALPLIISRLYFRINSYNYIIIVKLLLLFQLLILLLSKTMILASSSCSIIHHCHLLRLV